MEPFQFEYLKSIFSVLENPSLTATIFLAKLKLVPFKKGENISGSMQSIADSTVEGFNTFLNEQQNAAGEAFMTLVQFDDRYETKDSFIYTLMC